MFFLRTTTRALPHHPTTLLRRAFTTTPRQLDISRVQLIGRVGTEPEVTQTQNGVTLVKYSLAVNLGYGEKARTQWHRIAVFGEGQAERIQKGSKVFVEGDLNISTYDGEDGKKLTSVTVTQRSLSLINKPLSATAAAEEA